MRHLKHPPRLRIGENGVCMHGWRKFGQIWADTTDLDHTHAWWVAKQLQREMRYDFVQYDESFSFDYEVYLYYDHGECVGGLMMRRWPPDEKHDHSVSEMCWAWIKPIHRNRGILSSVWGDLRRWHGDFYVQGPLSEDMQAFLRRPGFHAANFGGAT